MNKYVIILLLGIFLVGAIFVINLQNSNRPVAIGHNNLSFEVPKCGNNFCESDEKCNSCPQDCGCKGTEYCDSKVGICRTEICGNNICNKDEETSCCQDCGCPENQKCIPTLGACKQVTLQEDILEKSVIEYAKTKGFDVVVTNAKDSYYKNSFAKEVMLNCTNKKCTLLAYVDETGKVLSLTRLE